MAEEQLGGSPAGPYVPPPESSAPITTPASVSVPPVTPVNPISQAPATPPKQEQPVPAVPPKAEEKSAVEPAKPVEPAPGTPEGLLDGLDQIKTEQLTAKPSLEALKVPEGVKYPKEVLEKIVSSSATAAEAQARLDTASDFYSYLQGSIVAKHKGWIDQLKADTEFGGQNWEASVNLYKRGVVEEFGEDFAKELANAKLESEPHLFAAVVRRMKAKLPKPAVKGEPLPPQQEDVSAEATAKNIYKGMATGYKQPTGTNGRW